MNAQPFTQWLTELSLPERAKALNWISFDLTVYAREWGLPESPSLGKLVGFNELQHTLLPQIGHYLHGEEVKVYPIDAFIRILIEKAEQHGITDSLASAFEYVMNRVRYPEEP
jgi:hypothetical protein